jgi:heat shock protein HslJ
MSIHPVRRVVRLVALSCAVAAASCSHAIESPLSPSSTPGESGTSLTSGQLAGTWTLTSLQTGSNVQPAPAGATYTLTFDDDRISTRADCNVCGGVFRVSGSELSIGPALACTRAACPTMAFETIYESMLAGDSTATLDGSTLTLSSARGRLTFVR